MQRFRNYTKYMTGESTRPLRPYLRVASLIRRIPPTKKRKKVQRFRSKDDYGPDPLVRLLESFPHETDKNKLNTSDHYKIPAVAEKGSKKAARNVPSNAPLIPPTLAMLVPNSNLDLPK